MSTPAAVPNHATLREFCDAQGWKPSYGHQLKREGRLVLHTDGKTVLVAESVARIAATRDPSKQGVAERHAAGRAKTAKAATGKPALQVAPPVVNESLTTADASAPPPAAADDADQVGVQLYDFQNSKAKREHWAAEREHAAFRKEAGELIELTEHIAAMANIGAMVRSKLEAWAGMLPPQLLGRDEAAMRAVLASNVEAVLNEITAQARAAAAAEKMDKNDL